MALIWLWTWANTGVHSDSNVKRIRGEGGEVLECSAIGFIFSHPFRGVAGVPSYKRYRVRYGDRLGAWYVRMSFAGPSEWVWVDEKRVAGVPVPRGEDSHWVASLRRISPRVILYAFLALCVAGAIAFRLAQPS